MTDHLANKILRFVMANPNLTGDEIYFKTYENGISEIAVKNRLRKLEKEGRVKKAGKYGKKPTYVAVGSLNSTRRDDELKIPQFHNPCKLEPVPAQAFLQPLKFSSGAVADETFTAVVKSRFDLAKRLGEDTILFNSPEVGIKNEDDKDALDKAIKELEGTLAVFYQFRYDDRWWNQRKLLDMTTDPDFPTEL